MPSVDDRVKEIQKTLGIPLGKYTVSVKGNSKCIIMCVNSDTVLRFSNIDKLEGACSVYVDFNAKTVGVLFGSYEMVEYEKQHGDIDTTVMRGDSGASALLAAVDRLYTCTRTDPVLPELELEDVGDDCYTLYAGGCEICMYSPSDPFPGQFNFDTSETQLTFKVTSSKRRRTRQ